MTTPRARAQTNTFTALIHRARHYGVRSTDPPRSIGSVAAALGVSRQTIYNLLDGVHTPRPHVRQRIAEGLSGIIERPVDEILAQLNRHWSDVNDLL